ncbi:MAG: Ribulose bisphosphate carboxylase [Candidatus Methanolliviera sp. GoM_oil]|nr:MAG: Ribulose bisphosphate carboxylase [Candidatus Methanolliviera sp. GoM_oil]
MTDYFKYETLGKDIIIQAGGGVHGHPDGSLAGARALRESVDACMEGIELKEYAKTHEELWKAIEKWGVV